jgi:hypothetical protein
MVVDTSVDVRGSLDVEGKRQQLWAVLQLGLEERIWTGNTMGPSIHTEGNGSRETFLW